MIAHCWLHFWVDSPFFFPKSPLTYIGVEIGAKREKSTKKWSFFLSRHQYCKVHEANSSLLKDIPSSICLSYDRRSMRAFVISPPSFRHWFSPSFSRVRARIPGDLAFLLSQPSHNGAKNGDLRFSHTINKIMTQNTSREPYFGVLHAIERSLS